MGLQQIEKVMDIKRNNPGNIRKAKSFVWQGEQPGTEVGQFVTFATLQDGYRAMIKLLSTYVTKKYNTLSKIINRWAPASDNNTPAAYIKFVSEKTGIAPGEVVTGAQLPAIAYAMSFVEHGIKEDDGTLQAAVSKAKDMLKGIIDTVEKNPAKAGVTVLTVAVLIYFIFKK